ncbi:hypothetical protein [Stigmatella aurantiaca]|nr:hypothetical protein [Stigmatella aurantiaca]
MALFDAWASTTQTSGVHFVVVRLARAPLVRTCHGAEYAEAAGIEPAS